MAAVRISGKNGTNQKFVSYVVRKGKNVGSTNVAKVNLNLHMVNSSVTDMTFRQFFVIQSIAQQNWQSPNNFYSVYQTHLTVSDIPIQFHTILLNGCRKNALDVSVTDMTQNGQGFLTY